MDHQIGFGDAVAELHDFDVAVGLLPNALVAILAKNERLAVFELQNLLTASLALGQREPRAIVEDIAVLQNFDERRAFMAGAVFSVSFRCP